MTEAEALILRKLDELQHDVALLLERQGVDGNLRPFLRAVHAFAGTSGWTSGELIDDAHSAHARAMLDVIATITGGRGDAAIRLGVWCKKHAGRSRDGLRLVRIRLEGGSWLYAVESAE